MYELPNNLVVATITFLRVLPQTAIGFGEC